MRTYFVTLELKPPHTKRWVVEPIEANDLKRGVGEGFAHLRFTTRVRLRIMKRPVGSASFPWKIAPRENASKILSRIDVTSLT